MLAAFKQVMDQLAEIYVNTMNTIHYMHDKYAYEAGQMALHDPFVHRYIAFGLAGLSIAADSCLRSSTQGKTHHDEHGIAVDFTSRRAVSPATAMTMTGWIIAVEDQQILHGRPAQNNNLQEHRNTPCPCSPSPLTWFTARRQGQPRWT